jgi:hypothetical protein
MVLLLLFCLLAQTPKSLMSMASKQISNLSIHLRTISLIAVLYYLLFLSGYPHAKSSCSSAVRAYVMFTKSCGFESHQGSPCHMVSNFCLISIMFNDITTLLSDVIISNLMTSFVVQSFLHGRLVTMF